jgi:hypothetical protein
MRNRSNASLRPEADGWVLRMGAAEAPRSGRSPEGSAHFSLLVEGKDADIGAITHKLNVGVVLEGTAPRAEALLLSPRLTPRSQQPLASVRARRAVSASHRNWLRTG